MRLRGSSTAPAERLAAFRILLGVFVVGYLVIRSPVFIALGERSAAQFDPAGVFRLIGRPLVGTFNVAFVVGTVALGVAFGAGWRFRFSGPLFAVAVLVVMSHRSSWGQLLHFENLMVLHVIVVGLSPAADAWSADARRAGGGHPGPAASPADDRYGFPLLVASVVMVVTYVIAGIAKLRYGGVDWITGDTLRNHIAYSATRLELLGGWASPAASWVVDAPWALRPMAALSVALELAAPVALLGGRWRNTWVAATWLMHVGIYVLMLVGFPSPLFLIAFAPLFPLERIGRRLVMLRAGRLRWRG